MSKSSITLCFIHESFLVCTYGYLHDRVQKWRSGGNLRFKPCLLPWLKQSLLLLFFSTKDSRLVPWIILSPTPLTTRMMGLQTWATMMTFIRVLTIKLMSSPLISVLGLEHKSLFYLLVDSLMFPHIYYTAFLLYYYTMLTYFTIQYSYILI